MHENTALVSSKVKETYSKLEIRNTSAFVGECSMTSRVPSVTWGLEGT